MAWNTPGSNKPDPWRGKRKGSDGDPMQRLRDMFGGGGSSGFNPLMVVAAIFLVWLLFNSFKLIDERERGVVLRFGDFNRIMQPGPNFKWPWPIETAIVVDATNVFTLSGEVRVLTQDENIVDIKYNVQYRKTDPRVFLFGSADPETTLKQAAESAVREAVSVE